MIRVAVAPAETELVHPDGITVPPEVALSNDPFGT
jgi:hypothetical protein